ncbi:MAG: TadE/TadG family type IV pilus assembly protein [Isosphaeraceae bacterium]
MVFPNRSSNRGGRRRGAAATELAVLLPVLVLVLIGAIDFCRLFFHYTTITNAARNGALWASDPLAPNQSPYATVQDAALADANNLNPALTAANVTSSTGTDGQGNATVSVTVQYQFNMISTYLGFSNVNLSRQVTMRVAPAAPN